MKIIKILIVGAGAIGGVTAAYMSLGGYDVTLMCRSPKTAEIIRSEGLRISDKRGIRQVIMPAVSSPSELTCQFDAVLIATKAYDMPEAANSILPLLKSKGLAVSVQNGICVEELARIAGHDRTAAAVVTWSSTMIGDAHLSVTASGSFIIGRTDGSLRGLSELKTAMDAAFPTRISDNIIAEMFSKLVINSGITCGGAMTGQTLGEMLRRKPARKFFISVVREDVAVAEAMGLTIPPFGGKLDYYRFVSGKGALSDFRRHAVLFAVGLKYRDLTSSSLTALRRGRPTEVLFLNGWVSKKGHEYGVATPANDTVCRIIAEIEAGSRVIGPDNMKEFS